MIASEKIIMMDEVCCVLKWKVVPVRRPKTKNEVLKKELESK